MSTQRRVAASLAPRRAGTTNDGVRLFISYSHRNRVWMDRLKPLFYGFQTDDRLTKDGIGVQYVHAWHDSELTAGNQWDAEIRGELDAMNIFVPLVSYDFFASWYIQHVELPRAKQRHKRKEILVVPILLYPTNLQDKCAFLHSFVKFPADDRDWRSYGDPRAALRLIDDGLWGAIAQVQKARSGYLGAQ